MRSEKPALLVLQLATLVLAKYFGRINALAAANCPGCCALADAIVPFTTVAECEGGCDNANKNCQGNSDCLVGNDIKNDLPIDLAGTSYICVGNAAGVGNEILEAQTIAPTVSPTNDLTTLSTPVPTASPTKNPTIFETPSPTNSPSTNETPTPTTPHPTAFESFQPTTGPTVDQQTGNTSPNSSGPDGGSNSIGIGIGLGCATIATVALIAWYRRRGHFNSLASWNKLNNSKYDPFDGNLPPAPPLESPPSRLNDAQPTKANKKYKVSDTLFRSAVKNKSNKDKKTSKANQEAKPETSKKNKRKKHREKFSATLYKQAISWGGNAKEKAEAAKKNEPKERESISLDSIL